MKHVLTITILSIYILACNDSKPKTLIAASQAVQIDNSPGECPYLTKDSKGNTVLSWVKMINDSTTALCYAISSDGKTFSQPIVVPNSGNIQPHGEIGIIWLDNRKTTTKEGSALYFASTNGKNGFEGGRLIAEPCCQCCRTDLYVDKKGGIHALFRGIVQDSIRDMVHIASTDGGNTFSIPKRINEDNWVLNGCPHTGPAMTENNEGIHFAWFTGGKNKGCYYTKTTDDG